MTSALEGVAAKLQEALGDHGGPQMSTGDVSSEAGTTTCGTDGSLLTKEKKEAADELASLEAALSALGATRGTTQIAQELRELIANKKKTLAATKPHWGSCGLQSVGRKVQGTTRPGSRSVQIGVSSVGESRRGGGPVNARVGSPGRGAGKSAARTSSGDTNCGCHGAGQMHEQDLGGREEVPQHPTRSCERNGDVNENPRGRCGPLGDVFFSASWGREGAGGEQEQAVEAGAKAADTTTPGSGRRRTSAHDGIDGANRRVAGYGRCHKVNIANLCVQRGQHEKRHWPVQVNEFKTPSAELGSKETSIQRPCHGAQKNEFVARSASHHFRVATANVRTLCDKGKSTAVTGSGSSVWLGSLAGDRNGEMRPGPRGHPGGTDADGPRRSLRAKVTGIPVSTTRLLVAWLR